MIIERAVQFGEGRRLSGVLTRATTLPLHGAIGLVNSGFIPRSGPARVYTQLARRLAQHGIASLRFDLGGLGDSIGSTDGRLVDRTRTETGAAVEVMAAELPGIPLALGGICSGAEDSFRQAESDPRIHATVLIDPFAWRTRGFAWRHTRHRLYRWSLRALGIWSPRTSLSEPDWVNFKHMERDEAGRILQALVTREATTHFIYTGGRRELFNHLGQLAKMLPDIPMGERITVDFLPELGHTQLLQEDRDRLIETIVRRLTTSLSPRASHPR